LKTAGKLDARAGRDAVPDAVARLAAEPQTPATDLPVELERLRRQLAGARPAAQNLDLWLAVLGSGLSRGDTAAAVRDAEQVLADPSADGAARSKAAAVKELAARPSAARAAPAETGPLPPAVANGAEAGRQ